MVHSGERLESQLHVRMVLDFFKGHFHCLQKLAFFNCAALEVYASFSVLGNQMFQRFGGSLQHLSVYLSSVLSQMTNTFEWRYLWDRAWEAPGCQASVLAFRGAAAHVVDISVAERKELASLLTAVGMGLRGALLADPAGYFLTLSVLECHFPAHRCVLSC